MTSNRTNIHPTLLAILAHPDDESFGMGGTLALYAKRGVDVHLICATRGEAGMVSDEHLNGYRSVAEKREAELCCAAEVLGLKSVIFLDYRDSGMPGSPDNEHPKAFVSAPLEEVVAQLVQHIRKIKPQVVLTFDPIGGYRHPDHIAIHTATVKAFKAAGDPRFESDIPPYSPQKMYFHTFSRRFLRMAVRLMPIFGKNPKRWGRNNDIDLASLAVEDFPTHAEIDFKPVEKIKEQAAACHISQDGPRFTAGFTGWIFRVMGGKEIYMRAYPPAPPGLREHDLFEEVEGVESVRAS
jgi:LmbE family N-acetylglucosaminyl deacetylase